MKRTEYTKRLLENLKDTAEECFDTKLLTDEERRVYKLAVSEVVGLLAVYFEDNNVKTFEVDD